jgi:hypothetical protein
MLKPFSNSKSWTRKRNNVKRLFKGEAYRLTGYGILKSGLVRMAFLSIDHQENSNGN